MGASFDVCAERLELDAHPLQGDVCFFAVFHESLCTLMAEVGAGDDDVVNAILLYRAAQCAVAAEDPESVNSFALLSVVIVQKADRLAAQCGVIQ